MDYSEPREWGGIWASSALVRKKKKKKKHTAGNERLFPHIFATQITDVAKRAAAQGNCKLVQCLFVFLLPSVTKPELKEHVRRRGVTVTQAGCYSHPRQNRQDNHRKNVTLWRETHLENLFHIMWRVKTPGMSWISGSEDVCIFFFCAAVVSNLSKDTILVWICVGSAPSRAA